jgi:hypothetical protein
MSDPRMVDEGHQSRELSSQNGYLGLKNVSLDLQSNNTMTGSR